jgi:hypothetical protein
VTFCGHLGAPRPAIFSNQDSFFLDIDLGLYFALLEPPPLVWKNISRFAIHWQFLMPLSGDKDELAL